MSLFLSLRRHLASHWNSRWGVLLLIGIIVYLGYGNTLRHSFHFDDERFILKRPLSTHFRKVVEKLRYDPPRVEQVPFYATQAADSLFTHFPNRNLVQLTFAINYVIGGEYNTRSYHLVNLFFHTLNAFLLFLLLQMLFTQPRVGLPLLGALYFAIHPLHTSSVTYILQRQGLMATTFYLLGFMAYIRWRLSVSSPQRWRWGLWGLLCFGLALLCKEMVITLPLMCLAYEGVFHLYSPKHRKRYFTIIPIALLVWGLFSLSASHEMGLWSQNSSSVGFNTDSLHNTSEHLFTASRAFVHYWRLLALPFPQVFNIDHDFPVSIHVLEANVLLSMLFHIGLLILAGYWLKRRVLLGALGIFWFYITLLPYAIVPERDVLVEYKTYLPSIGWIFILMQLGLWMESKLGERSQKRAWQLNLSALSILLFMMLLWGTQQRNRIFESELTLWQDTVKKSPNKARAQHNLAVAYHIEGQYPQAIEAFRSTIALEPRHFKAHKNLGASYEAQGRYDKAIEWYLKATRLHPGYVGAYIGLGNSYTKLKQLENAIRAYETAVQLNPNLNRVYRSLGNNYKALNQPKKARFYFQRFLQNNPNDRYTLRQLRKLR